MIARISGKLVEKKNQSLIIHVNGLYYEVIVQSSILECVDGTLDRDGHVHLVTYHYFQMSPTGGVPMLVGFIHEVERDFFLQFIKVSGIGPRAAVKALNKPISEISRAIDAGDMDFLKTLPGIGMQKAKEVVAKLQGKVGVFGLIQDAVHVHRDVQPTPDWQEEALAVLLQLQYKKHEAVDMIDKALKRRKDITTAEDLLNEVYKQKVKG